MHEPKAECYYCPGKILNWYLISTSIDITVKGIGRTCVAQPISLEAKKDEDKHVVATRFESFRFAWLLSRMAALLEPQPNFTHTFHCQAKGKIMLLIQKLEEECVGLSTQLELARMFRRASFEHVRTRPHSIFGLAVACADRMQARKNMRAPAGPGGEKFPVILVE